MLVENTRILDYDLQFAEERANAALCAKLAHTKT